MTDYVASPSNAQTRINSLLPGDTLTLSAGTYTPLTIGVSGTPTQPIQIMGPGVDNKAFSTAKINGGDALKITGSYVHVAFITVTGGSRGVVVDGASHIKVEKVFVDVVSAEAFTVYRNSRYVWLENCNAGWFRGGDAAGQTMTKGYRVGTPSSGWSGGVPDRTEHITLQYCGAQGVRGTSFIFYEGSRFINVRDCVDNHDETNPTGAQWNSYESYADTIRFERDGSLTAPLWGFLCKTKVVNGVTYGKGQVLYRPRVRLPSWNNVDSNGVPVAGAVGSNANDFECWLLSIDGDFGRRFPDHIFMELEGSNWTQTGFHGPLDPDDYVPQSAWFSPAEDYLFHNRYLDQAGQYGLMPRLYGLAPEVVALAVSDDPHRINTLTGYDCSSGVEFYTNPPEDRLVAAYKIGYFQEGAGNISPIKGCIRDMETGQIVPGTLINLVPANTKVWGWWYTDLPQPVLLEPFRHYRVQVYSREGTTNLQLMQYQSDWLGLFPGDFFNVYAGANGLDNRITVIPNRANSLFGSPSRTGYPPPGTGIENFDLDRPKGVLVQGGIGNIYLVDCMVGFYREPDTFHANPGDDLQKLVDQLIPGDTLIISGLHVVDLLIRVRGTPLRPIVIKGDGTAVIRGPFGDDEVFSAFHLNHARYLYIHDLIIEHTGRAVFVEDSQHIKLERITARYTRSGGFTTSEYCDDIVHLHCTAHNTGYDLNTGDGFRCGTTPSDWPRGDTVPETTTRIRYENCKAWNNFGDGFDINAAASQVVLKNCSVDFTKGTKPHAEAAVGASGFHCRADKVQFISCSVIGAPLDGFRCFDVLWSKVIYGRNQEVKGGSSTGHGEAGVASQSEGMKVYSDFAASAPRILEVEGGWAGTGSNVNLSTFTEISWVSQALAYFDYS